MSSVSITKHSMILLWALAVIVMGWAFPQLNVKGIAVSTLALILTIMVVIPMKWSLFVCLIYIGFEGVLKIISDYNPVVHIGSDILVILLFLRALSRAFTRGNPLPGYLPPLMALFIFHFTWVIITLFNPYSLGFIPSIAGSKIYVTMPLLFFFGYYLCENVDDFHFFVRGFILVALAHTAFGLYQGMIGPSSVLSLHPRYAIQLEMYKDSAFRPFGLTNLPGGPAIYLSSALPLTIYYALRSKSLFRLFLFGFCAAALSLIMLCQVRSALLKTILGTGIFLTGYLSISIRSKGRERIGIGAVVVAALILVIAMPKITNYSSEQSESNKVAIERTLSLFDYDKIKHARRGTWDRFVTYLGEVPFGAGFARVGASAGAFKNTYDPYFKPYYFFADNFWIACLVEVGLPGMFVLTLILFSVVGKGFSIGTKLRSQQHRLAAYAILAVVVPLIVGLYGSEGILYNPDASFFWLLSGILLKLPRMEHAAHKPIEAQSILEPDYRAL